MSVRISEPMIEVKKKSNYKAVSIQEKRRKTKEAYAECDKEEHIRQVRKNETAYCDLSDEKKARAKQNSYANNRKNKRSRRLHSRYTGALPRDRPSKICNMCKANKTLSSFDNNKNKDRPKTRRTYCFGCRRKMNREYYLKNKEKWANVND